MSDLILRAAAFDAVSECGICIRRILDISSVDTAPVIHGKWKEKLTVTGEGGLIGEWQSARCSNCGRYHTTPYMYYFTEHKYCPHCGAKMDEEEDEE